MIIIRKISGLIILAAFFLSSAFAENGVGNYGFTLSPNIGILYGQSEEIVYKEPPLQNIYLSELLWDLKPLLYAGLGVDFGPLDSTGKKGFAAALLFKAGLPARTGIIEDRDWISPPNEVYLTHYSRHDAYTKTAIFLDVSAGYLWRFFDSLALNAHGEFSYMHFSWSGTGGYSQYSVYFPWDSNLPKTYYAGEVIQYRQNWFILSPGITLDWKMNRLFSMKTNFSFSPLIYCSDRDDHLLTDITFLDYLYFGRYLKAGGEVILSPSQNTGISLFASYKHISGVRGNTFQGTRLLAEDSAGAALSSLDMGLTVKFRLTGRN